MTCTAENWEPIKAIEIQNVLSRRREAEYLSEKINLDLSEKFN